MLRGLGLGLMVGAVLHSTAQAQVRDTARTKRDTLRSRADSVTANLDTAARRDTTRELRVGLPPRADSLIRRDTAGAQHVARDTIKAPLTAAEAPVMADPTGSFVWDRRDIFATAALTVQDLLARIPGVTVQQSAWIAHPMVGTFLGDPGRVRVFMDGLELQEMDPRMRGMWDLSQIPLWALDDIRVERGASEIRIYLRTWRVDRTTPYTRTDIYTGDQGTNLYRGLFGRRYNHGESLQLAGQQYATSGGRQTESSDQLGLVARLGIARPRWSADAFLFRADRSRGRAYTLTLADTIAGTQSTRSEAYVRVGVGHSDRGFWGQALANASRYVYGGKTSSVARDTLNHDTTTSQNQYVLAGGYVRGPWHASVTQRYFVGSRRHVATPSARAGLDARRVTLSLLADGRGLDSTRRFEASAVVRPLSFVFLGGAMGKEQLRTPTDSSTVTNFSRAEAGVRVGDVWLSAGSLRRDATLLDAPQIFRPSTVAVISPASDGIFATIRGRLWKALYADIQGVKWSDTSAYYVPRYQTRSELYLSTSMLRRFPTRNFHVLASAVHEYHSGSLWPDSAGVRRLGGYRTISTLLQFQIVRAEVFWNFRNLLGERYELVPGYRLPRLTNIYGVRWEFWN